MFKNMEKKNIQSYIIWLIFVIIVIYFSIASDKFLQISNFISIVRDAMFLGIIACGLTFVMITGLIDLSIGSAVGMVGLTISMMVTKGWSGLIGIFIIPTLVSLSISLFNSFVITKLKMPPLILTLAMMIALKGIRRVIYGSHDILLRDMPKMISFISRDFIWGIPVSVYIFILIIILSSLILHKTPFGRNVFVVGANEHAAFLNGISPTKIRISAFLILGFFVYISSFILVGRIGGYSISMGENYEMVAILAVVVGGTSLLGGRGSIIGGIGGVLVMSTLSNGLVLTRVPYPWQKVILGIIFILVVALDKFYNKKKEYDFAK